MAGRSWFHNEFDALQQSVAWSVASLNELIESVLSGDNGDGGQMPAFKEMLSGKDVFDIFAYITYINQSK